MKLTWKQIEPFVKNPDPAARVILIYGPDSGLMRERASVIGKTMVEDLNDPFNAVTLSTAILGDDPARLSDEANAMSMMGGRRLIRVEDASDKLTTLIADYLAEPNDNALIILEAGDLGPRSSLRKLCEKEPNAAALPCYIEDERGVAQIIRTTVQEASKSIDNDAVQFLAANIAGDRGRVRSELSKLLLYKGAEAGAITLEDARAACGEAGDQNLDDLIYNAAGNNPENALRIYNRMMEEDVPFIVILRSLQNHFRRLHLVKTLIEQGQNADQAMKALQPPVFFKQADAFRAQAGRWSSKNALGVLSRLMEVEAACKQTGAPTETLCAQAVLGISRMRG